MGERVSTMKRVESISTMLYGCTERELKVAKII